MCPKELQMKKKNKQVWFTEYIEKTVPNTPLFNIAELITRPQGIGLQRNP